MIDCPLQSPFRITQRFGQNAQKYRQFGVKGHPGIDLAGPVPGVSVIGYAPASGQVVTSGPFGEYGNCVRILLEPGDDGNRSEITLGHFKSINPEIKPGMSVKLGQPLGLIGKTGFADGIHIHLGLRILKNDVVLNKSNGYNGFIDPEPFLRSWAPLADGVKA